MDNSFQNGQIKRKLIERSNFQGLGKHYFKKAMEKILINDFDNASMYIKEGLNYLSCDCNNDKWVEQSGIVTIVDWEDFFSKGLKTSSDSYLFTFSYLSLFSPDSYIKKYINHSLSAINKYLENNDCKYGYYVKARILTHNNEVHKAIAIFKDKFEYPSNPPLVKYRLGRLDESLEGFISLIEAFMSNPSCSCTIREIYERFHEKVDSNGRRIIKNENYIKGKLCKAFSVNNNFREFMRLYIMIIDNMPNLNFHLMTKHTDDYFSGFFNYILKLYKSNFALLKRINWQPNEKNLRPMSLNNSVDDEETIMRALQNGQGDKFGY
ncbi:hypothetical protein [Marivirga sp.]|uniref:hypothetical protein n=1 Tax=Marivirga sp. TaxID=2018662 RepID=UPI0025E3E948|nr:hypothetical protein [Marivirga sp.]